MTDFSYDISYLVIQFCLGAIITFAFAIFFNAPKKSLFDCSIIGAFSWLLFIWGEFLTNDLAFGTFIAAMWVGISATNASKRLKMPATVFIYTGIIPLIPGYSIYYTMYNLVLKDYAECLKWGFNTVLIAGAIAMGILIASVFSESIQRVKIRRRKENKRQKI